MGSGLASDTDALQLDAGFGAPGGHALPLLLNRVCICVIRVICGDVLLGRERGDPPSPRLRRGQKTNRLPWGERINDFFESGIAS